MQSIRGIKPPSYSIFQLNFFKSKTNLGSNILSIQLLTSNSEFRGLLRVHSHICYLKYVGHINLILVILLDAFSTLRLNGHKKSPEPSNRNYFFFCLLSFMAWILFLP